VSQQKTKGMARRKLEIAWPHLYNAGGDLSKTWFVEYSIRNPVTGKMERFKHSDGFKKLKTVKERMEYAQKLIEDFTQKIKSGEIGFNEVVEYDDLLSYNGFSSFSRRKEAMPGSITIYLSDFIEYKQSEVSERTIQTYRSKMRMFNSYLQEKKLHDKPVFNITNNVIIDFLKSVTKEKGLSRLSIEKYQQILYTFFVYLSKVKNVKIENPVMNIPRMGKVVDNAPVAIPSSMRIALKNEIEKEDPQLWMSCCFIYYTAIRPGKELRLLKIKNINFTSQTITVFNELSKNRRTETIDIPDNLQKLITEVWKLQDYNYEFYLFGRDGCPGTQPLGKNTMRIRFNKIRDKLKLPKDIKYYSWKHSGAQELADAGANTYELQRHLRHRELATTESYLRKRIGQRSNMIKHNFPSIG